MPDVMSRDAASGFTAWNGTREPDLVPRDSASDFAAQRDTHMAGLEELEKARQGPEITNVDTGGSEVISCSDDDCAVLSACADDEVAHVLVGQLRVVCQ